MKTRNLLILVVTILTTFTFSSSVLQAELKWYAYGYDFINPAEDSFRKIDCIDSLDCIMLMPKNGVQCRLYESKDGGFTWTKFYEEIPDWNDPNTAFVYNMAWPSENYLYLTYDFGRIKKSTDRGKTWKTFHFPHYPHAQLRMINHIYMLDSVTGIAAAPWSDLYTTNDGWETYTKHENTPTGGRQDVWMFSADSYAFLSAITSEVSCFVKTTDNGLTWELSKFDHMGVNAMHFINENIGYAVGNERDPENSNHSFDVIHRTTDGGQTWVRIYKNKDEIAPFGLSDPQNGRSVSFYDEMNGIAVGNFMKVLRTTDGGNTWFREFLGDTSNSHEQNDLGLNVYYIGSDAIISAFTTRAFYRLYDPDANSVYDYQNNIQINTYPNPFSESVSFEFTAELAGEQISLSIYDMLGNLQAEEKFIYSRSMGILQYTPKHSPATGVYFYRLRIGDKEHTGTLIKQ